MGRLHPVVTALRTELAELERQWRALDARTKFVRDSLNQAVALYGDTGDGAAAEAAQRNGTPPLPTVPRARRGGPTDTILRIVYERPGIGLNELLESATVQSTSRALNKQVSIRETIRQMEGRMLRRSKDGGFHVAV